MHPYLFVPLSACAAAAFAAGLILARDWGAGANRWMGLLCLGTTWWAGCEVLWNAAGDAQTAMFFLRLGVAGFAWIGPLCLHLLLDATENHSPRLRSLLPAAYSVSGVIVLAGLTTDWMHVRVLKTSWGWGYEFGPLFLYYYCFTLAGLGLGLWAALGSFREFASPGEMSQANWVLAGVSVPLVVASLTDVLLPLARIQVPRFGTLSMASLGIVVTWSFHRFGYSLLAPGRFAPEILESLSDGVMLIRPNGSIRRMNDAMAELIGCNAEAAAHEPVRRFLPFVPTDPPRKLDGVEGELILWGGQQCIPVSVSSSILQDKRCQLIGIVLVVHDLREMVGLRNRLVTSGRLAAVGQLAAGIAHEINNPLAYVQSNLGLLREHWSVLRDEVGKSTSVSKGHADLDERVAEGEDLIVESLEGVARAAAIVRDVKGFSHAGAGARQQVDVNALLEGVLRVASPQLRGHVEVAHHWGRVPPVRGAPQELQQVFINLILNAAQAVEDGGRVEVRTECEHDIVEVHVIDDGCGIPAEYRDQIFDPFFTTKPVGKGTGLGLAISYQIIRKHGGEIRVASGDRGTTFTVRLLADLD